MRKPKLAHYKRKLSKDEKTLKAVYDKVLTIATTEKAVVEGDSFDLMYANTQYHRQYAFLRKAGSDVLLVVANFVPAELTIDLTIPSHAFEFLNLKEKHVQAVDLMTDQKQKLALQSGAAVKVALPPLGAVVLKFKA